MEQAPILHYCDIWNFFVTNYTIFWERNRQKLKYISLNLTITKLFLEKMNFLKHFIFKEKKSVKENLLEYVGIFYFQLGVVKIFIQDWNVELAMLLPFQVKSHQFKAKMNEREREREREREESSLLTAFFSTGFFLPKREIQIKNWKMKWFQRVFNLPEVRGKRVKISQISIFGFQCAAKRLIIHPYEGLAKSGYKPDFIYLSLKSSKSNSTNLLWM